MSKNIRIGAWDNELAHVQARVVANLIRPSGYGTKLINVSGNDSRINTIDIFVLRAEDVPIILEEELELIGFTKRRDVNDVVLATNKKLNLSNTGIRISTSSPRSKAFLDYLYPKARVEVGLNGPKTGVRKLKGGQVDAFVTSFADAAYLGFEGLITENIETSYSVPSVGQGSIAIICHRKLRFDIKEVIQRWVNHPETEDCIRTERSFLKSLPRNISTPFGYAQFEGNLITLKAGYISSRGQIVKVKKSATVTESKELGKKVAWEAVSRGGMEILS